MKCGVIDQQLSRISELSSEKLRLKKYADNFEKLKLFNNKQETIVSIIEHSSKVFVITLKTELNYDGRMKKFYLYGYTLDISESDIVNSVPIIEMWCEPNYNLKLNYLESIFIVNFQAKNYYINKGFGSLIMNELIRYSKSLDVYYISGDLSSVDIGENDNDFSKKENRERLYHFYSKFGFEIYDEANSKDIIKKHIRRDLKSRE